MRTAAAAIAYCLLFSTQPASADGPLGISMGDSPEKLGCERLQGEVGLYGCTTVPRPYADGAIYAGRSSPSTGVCTIYIRSREIKTNEFGVQLRAAVDTVAADLAEAYGLGNKVDQLLAGSLWKKSEDWLMGLRRQDREYLYGWAGKALKDNILGIAAGARSDALGKGVVDIRFDFLNKTKCESEI